MKTAFGHLTYCTNIHTGERWTDHFAQLENVIPKIKENLAPHEPFGIGLRLSNQASLDLMQDDNLASFQHWLLEQDCYVFTMNGFPYGGFHHTVVKDAVHQPDWTSNERVAYTMRLAHLLAELLPDGMEGGISTSPLSYRHWFADESSKQQAIAAATANVMQVAKGLLEIKTATGKLIHLDIEPEPGGLLENGTEFINWFTRELIPRGTIYLQQELQLDEASAVSTIREHVTLCYDVCHFAIGFENIGATMVQLRNSGIRVGKIQISAALRAILPGEAAERAAVLKGFRAFNEPTYLHQVIGRQENGSLIQYNDLDVALEDAGNELIKEWRAHFHVPVFMKDYGLLQSTQPDIVEVLNLQKTAPFTTHLEVETYTWDVLPEDLKLPQQASILREMNWVLHTLNNDATAPANNQENA